MASNYALMMDALRIYREAMRTFVTTRLRQAYRDLWWQQGVARHFKPEEMERLEEIFQSRTIKKSAVPTNVQEMADMLDIGHFRTIVEANWRPVFKDALGDKAVLDGWIGEVTAARNALAHWAGGDVDRQAALRFVDTCRLVVTSFDDQAAAQIQEIWKAIDEGREPKAVGTTKEKGETAEPGRSPRGLAPWRDVIAPHPDVQSGRYLYAEFAADLAAVLEGKAEADYQDPREFFRRTYVTPDMRRLLRESLERLLGRGGEPVIDLKTAFGGGKTHTLLALYHLAKSGDQVKDLPDVRNILEDLGLDEPPKAHVAALVGTALSATKAHREVPELGVSFNTLWGEMAYQLGGAKALRTVLDDDAKGTAPGSNDLAAIFEDLGPCVVLMDEIVAFMRNIWGKKNLASGDYNSNITFLQNLTEAAKRVPTAMLMVAIPESKVEYGDDRGLHIAEQIGKIIGRIGRAWQPVGAHEAFEVVRRRLFQEASDPKAIEQTCEEFWRLYRDNPSDFPTECREPSYITRMRGSYPIHPEVFDRLYEDWSTLERFQRTRGVLRLMAATIHELWTKGDQSPLIMPGSIPIYAARVRDELTRYLGEQWNAVIDTDVDGEGSEPWQVDGENPRFGQIHAARRVTRTLLLGSVPSKTTKGVEDVRIKLGVIQPGESIDTYGDALGRLANRLGHIYASGAGRYWLDTPPNLVRAAADRTSKVTDDDAHAELESRLRQIKDRGDFVGVHLCPPDSSEVPDEAAARLVVVSPRAGHKRGESTSAALQACQDILDNRGNQPRRYRNMLVFAVADEESTSALLDDVRRYLAWKSIVADAAVLGLDKPQVRQAEDSERNLDGAVQARLDEAYRWVLVPVQEGTNPIRWETVPIRAEALGAAGSIAQRASYRLQADGYLITSWSPVHLRRELDDYLWKDSRPHIGIKQLWEYYATYCYLSRLKDHNVLLATIKTGAASRDYFAYATSVAPDGRYEGLAFGQNPGTVYFDDAGVVVRPEVAEAQRPKTEGEDRGEKDGENKEDGGKEDKVGTKPKRFHGTVHLDPQRLASTAGKVGDEVVQHIEGLLGAKVDVILEISATVEGGVPDEVVRIVIENAKTLKFDHSAFEEE